VKCVVLGSFITVYATPRESVVTDAGTGGKNGTGRMTNMDCFQTFLVVIDIYCMYIYIIYI